MIDCFYGVPNKRFEDVVSHWNKKLSKSIGKIGGSSPNDRNAELYINDVSEHLFKIPFNSDFHFSEGMINRMKREIDNIAYNYKYRKIGTFRRYFYVSDAIANYSPVTRVFYEKVNEAINYERNNLDQYLTTSKSIASHIRNALILKTGKSKKEVKKYQKRLADLERLIMVEGDEGVNTEYTKEYNDLFTKYGDEVINDYISLMEMDNTNFLKNTQRGTKYDRNVILAVKESRSLLDNMGKVLINGLDRMENVVKMVYDSPLLPKTGQKYVERIRQAKEKINKGIKEGGYLPHYIMDNIVEVNYKMRQALEAKKGNEADTALGVVVDKIETMIPDAAKSRNELLNNSWSKNPFFILTNYSKDVIAFNKINFIQEQYLPAMRKFQKDDTNPEFIRSMRGYLEDTFQVATKGNLERPNYVNAMVRGLMAVETLKSMGLSVTGAIRNGASAAYFFAENGISSATAAIGKYNSHYESMLTKIETEQGFKFAEGGRELVAEGLIPSSVNQSDIIFDPVKNKVTYRDRGVLKTLDPMIDNVIGKSLVFHRFTENATRKWMFRIAWVQAYENLKGHNVLKPTDYNSIEKLDSANERKIQQMATRFALKSVNAFAFEYAAHAKARAIGGTAPAGKIGPDGLPKMKGRDYATATGEMVFQFLHYPMSFLNLQSKILHGAKDAALSAQWDAPELRQALRFAGIYTAVQALSIATNLDFNNLLENDTVRRIRDMKDYLTLPVEEFKANVQGRKTLKSKKLPKELEGKRGLINDYTGPLVGDILYALNALQLYKMPDENWQRMLTGYIDYYGEGDVPDWVGPKKRIDTIEKRNMWNKLNTEFARWMTKTGPAIRDGRGMDIVRHELGLYPRSWIKDNRKAINKVSKQYVGFEPFRLKKGKNDGTLKLVALAEELRGK